MSKIRYMGSPSHRVPPAPHELSRRPPPPADRRDAVIVAHTHLNFVEEERREEASLASAWKIGIPTARVSQ